MAIEDRRIIPMTEDEKKSPVAKFYSSELAEPNPKLMDILSKGPMDSSLAIYPEDAASLLKSGYVEGETGYCNLENGAGYVAVNNQFPGCTLDMIKWWFAWHGFDSLRYKIWDPYCHYSVELQPETAKRFENSNLSIEEMITDMHHHVVEDVGGGKEEINISFLSPEKFGFSIDELHSAGAWPIGGNGFSNIIDKPLPKPIPAIMLHYYREVDGGIESRSRFWMGYSIVNGKPECLLPPGVTVPMEGVKAIAFHNVEEYSNLAVLLPKVYSEFGSDSII